MKELNVNLLAASIVICGTFCLIAVMYFTSFERHHTHNWPSQTSYAEQETSDQNGVTNESSISPFDRNKPINSAPPSQTNPAYTNQQSLQHYDHKSQIFMAIFTGFGIVVALVGLYMIWRTLIYTGSAATAATETLKVAQKTIEETKIASANSLRAYVGVKAFNYHFRPMTDGRAAFSASAVIKNFGQTPAYNHKNSSSIEVVVSPHDGQITPAPLNAEGITLFPSSEPLNTNNIILSAENVQALISRDKVVLVIIHIAYDDIYGESHWSKTQYRLGSNTRVTRYTEDHGATLTYDSESNSRQNINQT